MCVVSLGADMWSIYRIKVKKYEVTKNDVFSYNVVRATSFGNMNLKTNLPIKSSNTEKEKGKHTKFFKFMSMCASLACVF